MYGDDHKIQRILELSEENNKMLKKLVRAMRWARLLRIVYIVLIVGSAVGIFYFLQPILDQVSNTYGSFKESLGTIGNFLKLNQ